MFLSLWALIKLFFFPQARRNDDDTSYAKANAVTLWVEKEEMKERNRRWHTSFHLQSKQRHPSVYFLTCENFFFCFISKLDYWITWGKCQHSDSKCHNIKCQFGSLKKKKYCSILLWEDVQLRWTYSCKNLSNSCTLRNVLFRDYVKTIFNMSITYKAVMTKPLKNKTGNSKKKGAKSNPHWRASQTEHLIYNGNKHMGMFNNPMPLY